MPFFAAPGGPSAVGAGEAENPPVVLLVRDDDLRLLIRGVLTLYRYPVALEGSSPESLRRLGPLEQPTVLILDAGDGSGTWREDLAQTLRESPQLRAVVLFPAGAEASRAEAEALGARATVVRPVVLRELVAAIRAAIEGSSGSAPG